jgi:hypothetical protein
MSCPIDFTAFGKLPAKSPILPVLMKGSASVATKRILSGLGMAVKK